MRHNPRRPDRDTRGGYAPARMSRRLTALLLGLLLLLTQQWGTLHLLSHGLQGAAAMATADAGAPSDRPGDVQPDAGDALCQVCLVLASLAAAGLPALWRWLARPPRAAAPLAPPCLAAPRRAPAPWHARGPPALR
jgi:hypothetical protein